MKLYLLSQDENDDYDTYDSCVVCAENEEEAKKIKPHPDSLNDWNIPEHYKTWPSSTWCTKIENVECQYIGEADPSVEKGVVISSFNAG
jgi:hypothetical protein